MTSKQCFLIMLALSVFVLVLSVDTEAATQVEEFEGVIPESTFLFASTSGIDAVKPAFDASSLGQIWHDKSVQDFYNSVQPQLAAALRNAIRVGDPNDVKRYDAVVKLLKLVIHRPVIFGVADNSGAEEIPVCVYAIVNAGTEKDKIESAMRDIEALMQKGDVSEARIGSRLMKTLDKPTDPNMYWGWAGDYLVFVVGDVKGSVLRGLEKPDKTRKSVLADLPEHGDVLAGYVRFDKATSLVSDLAKAEGEDPLEKMRPACDKLGLTSVQTYKYRLGFDDTEMVSAALVEMGAERRGLFSMLQPVDKSMLKTVHEKSMATGLMNVDFAGIYDILFEVIQSVAPPEDYNNIKRHVAEFENEAGFKIRDGLLKSLDGRIMFYNLPMAVNEEVPSGGMVLAARVRDKIVFEKSLVAAEKYLQNKGGENFRVAEQIQADGQVIHNWVIPMLAMMQVMPCWATTDEYVVIASNPMMIGVALKRMTTSSEDLRSIVDTDKFTKATAKVPGEVIYLRYTDTGAGLNQFLMVAQQFWPVVSMAAAKEGIQLPAMFPSLGHLASKIEPTCEYNWFDARGLNYRMTGTGIDVSLRSIGGTSLAMGILMPALARTRQVAYRMASGSNMAGIGKACHVYANDHDGNMPPNLETLIKAVDLHPKMLKSKYVPKGSSEASYVYVAGQNVNMNPGNVLAYENPKYVVEGLNVLYLDGRVKFERPAEFRGELEATYRRLGQEMPEIRFKGDDGGEYPQSQSVPAGEESEPKESVLHEAVKQGDYEKVKTLLSEGIDINDQNDQSQYALMLAIESGHNDIIRLLIEKGADINVVSTSSYTPLTLAVMRRNQEAVELLVKSGANVNAMTNGRWTALHMAVRTGQIKLAEMLIDKGADINVRTDQEMTPLMLAVLHRHTDIEQRLRDKGAATDIFVETIKGDRKAVEVLLRSAPEVVNAKNGEFRPLHWAAYCGYIDILNVLVANGADVQADTEHASPLYWAVRKNHIEAAKLLLSAGAPVDAVNEKGNTVLHYVVSPEMAQLLIDKGADVNKRSEQGHTPLHGIVGSNGHKGVLKLLLQFGVDVSERHPESQHIEAEKKQIEIARCLLDNGADLNAKDNVGLTALEQARREGYDSVVRFLNSYQNQSGSD